jgi:hypothetical protein
MKTEFQKRTEAKQQAARELHKSTIGPWSPSGLAGSYAKSVGNHAMEKKSDAPADLRPNPGFAPGERPHACPQVEVRSRGDGGHREGDSQEGDSNCASVQQGRSAIPAGWKRPPTRLSDDQATPADECLLRVKSGHLIRRPQNPFMTQTCHRVGGPSGAAAPGIKLKRKAR